MEFSNLQVKDSKKTYKFVDEWDVDEDFDEKAYKCGINEVDDGVELCWGISQTPVQRNRRCAAAVHFLL